MDIRDSHPARLNLTGDYVWRFLRLTAGTDRTAQSSCWISGSRASALVTVKIAETALRFAANACASKERLAPAQAIPSGPKRLNFEDHL